MYHLLTPSHVRAVSCVISEFHMKSGRCRSVYHVCCRAHADWFWHTHTCSHAARTFRKCLWSRDFGCVPAAVPSWRRYTKPKPHVTSVPDIIRSVWILRDFKYQTFRSNRISNALLFGRIFALALCSHSLAKVILKLAYLNIWLLYSSSTWRRMNLLTGRPLLQLEQTALACWRRKMLQDASSRHPAHECCPCLLTSRTWPLTGHAQIFIDSFGIEIKSDDRVSIHTVAMFPLQQCPLSQGWMTGKSWHRASLL